MERHGCCMDGRARGLVFHLQMLLERQRIPLRCDHGNVLLIAFCSSSKPPRLSDGEWHGRIECLFWSKLFVLLAKATRPLRSRPRLFHLDPDRSASAQAIWLSDLRRAPMSRNVFLSHRTWRSLPCTDLDPCAEHAHPGNLVDMCVDRRAQVSGLTTSSGSRPNRSRRSMPLTAHL